MTQPVESSPDPLVGRRLSHYVVLERIGAGGMGVVYRARDERLPREVAIKVLPPGLLADTELRERFRREALALARLQHPAIATLFEFDHTGDQDFLVMEHVAGETLEERMAGGPLPEEEALALAGQILDALAAAHEQGVVHRDLKPGNVVVTQRGQVKVLDFGVAKFVGNEADEDLTLRTGGVPGIVGTLAYMAPEQMLEGAVDARADLYALGVVLYRMTTGRLPFEDLPPLALVNRILNETPRSPRELRPQVSARLDAIVMRCLEKDPERRYRSAAELAGDLARAGAAGVAAGPTLARPRLSSLVVLPLENLSGDPGQDYFADGMTETLIADLAQIAALRVISRTSAMRYKGARRHLPEIARELRVEAVVEGTVLRLGERVRVTVQLVEAAADCTLWAASYDRQVSDVLALQSELARTIAAEIRVRLTPQEEALLGGAPPVDPRVLEHYLRGRFEWNTRTPAGLQASVRSFQAALEIVPGYAPAWSGLADAWNILGAFRVLPPGEAFRQAADAAERALALEPRLAAAHASRAFALLHHGWDLPAAERSFQRALELNPGYVTARHWSADALVLRVRFDEALEQARRARELDPHSPVVGSTEASVQYYARRYEAAVALLREIVQSHPDFAFARLDLGRSLEELGRLDEARAAFEEAVRRAGMDPAESAALGHVHGLLGDRARAEAIAQRLVAARSRRHVSPFSIAMIYAGLGDPGPALDHLQSACEERDPMMVYLHVHPRLDRLRGEPRFQDLVRRVGVAG